MGNPRGYADAATGAAMSIYQMIMLMLIGNAALTVVLMIRFRP